MIVAAYASACVQRLTLRCRQGFKPAGQQQVGGWCCARRQHESEGLLRLATGSIHQDLSPAEIGSLELVHGQRIEELVRNVQDGAVLRYVIRAAVPANLHDGQSAFPLPYIMLAKFSCTYVCVCVLCWPLCLCIL